MKFDNVIKYFLVLALFLLSSACEEKTDWTFQPGENGALVVESIITNELKHQEIILSRSYDGLNDEPEYISGATVSVSGGGVSYDFQESSVQPGKYMSSQAFAAQLLRTYTLEVLWNGTHYSAENKMTWVYPFAPLTFRPFNESDSLQIGFVAPLYSPNEQAIYEIDVDWRHLVNSESARAKLFYYTFSTIDVNELFRPEKETIAFPKGSIVVEKKYSLDPDFAAYYRALVMETDWQGGIFDEASGSLPTNISNGGLGFFGVSAVLCDTLIAE